MAKVSQDLDWHEIGVKGCASRKGADNCNCGVPATIHYYFSDVASEPKWHAQWSCGACFVEMFIAHGMPAPRY